MNRIIAFLAGLLIAVSSAYAAKLPDETALGGAPASDDLIRMVDVSDHTQSGQGTTKRMTIAELFTSPTLTGSVAINGGTVTTNSPPINMTQEWNDSGVNFVGILFDVTDTGSGDNSKLIDMRIGGSSRWSVDKYGQILSPYVQINFNARLMNMGSGEYVGASNGVLWRRSNLITWSDQDNGTGGSPTSIGRPAVGLIEVNNGSLGSYAGTAIKTGPQTVSQLRACDSGATGARAYVTDATAAYTGANLGSTVSGGGSNKAPVICDGTNWTIGG